MSCVKRQNVLLMRSQFDNLLIKIPPFGGSYLEHLLDVMIRWQLQSKCVP